MDSETDGKWQTIKTYFNGLDDGNFNVAAQQFTPGVTYIHPPMYGDETHIHGRDALLTYLTEVRGETDTIHVNDRNTVSGNVVALTGHVEPAGGGEPLEHYVAYASFEGDLIDHYIAGLLRG